MNIKIVGDYFPEYATDGSSGFDLRAAIDEPLLVRSGTRVLVPTGLRFGIPPGYELQIRPRSGLSKKGIDVAFGTVDSDYRGEVSVCIIGNLPKYSGYHIQPMERIAQGVIAPVVRATFGRVAELEPTARGEGGFGSTGVK